MNAENKTVTLMSAKGTVIAPTATLYDRLGDSRKEAGTLAAGDAVEITAKADDDAGARPATSSGAFYAIKKDGDTRWIAVADVKLAP